MPCDVEWCIPARARKRRISIYQASSGLMRRRMSRAAPAFNLRPASRAVGRRTTERPQGGLNQGHAALSNDSSRARRRKSICLATVINQRAPAPAAWRADTPERWKWKLLGHIVRRILSCELRRQTTMTITTTVRQSPSRVVGETLRRVAGFARCDVGDDHDEQFCRGWPRRLATLSIIRC